MEAYKGTIERHVDVLIIGAGPAGLMTCTALAKYGIKVHIIDKRPEKVMVGQAAGLQPRTSEVLESYGLLDRLVKEGNQMHIAAFYNPSPDGRGIELTERVPAVAPSSARYPFQITIHQGVIEGVFLDSMQALDIEVDRPAIPVSLEVISDMDSSSGSCMIIPREDDKVRIYMQLDENSIANSLKNGRVDKSKIGPHELFEVAKKHLCPYSFGTPQAFEWFAIYIIGQGVASRFSLDDRVFIVGDACHTHSPKAGLGMNAGINDSHNLAWKLAHVLKGYAKPNLLQTYESERRKYAHDLIEFDKKLARSFSDRQKLQSQADSSSNGTLREELLQIFKTSNAFMIGVGIQYSESISIDATHQSLASGLPIGQRFPPHIFLRAGDGYPVEIQDLLPSDGRFKILIFSGDTTKSEPIQRLSTLSEALKGLLSRITGENETSKLFDTLVISSATTFSSTSNDIPPYLRPHWSKVLIDDTDAQGRQGGGGYIKYGLGPEGAVVVVRPDGYVAALAPLEEPEVLESYFSRFSRVK